jgi:hypothetical protein
LAKIIQQKVFSWKDVEASGELERLRMAIEAMPDDELKKALEAERKHRRDNYPIRLVWKEQHIGGGKERPDGRHEITDKTSGVKE